ncbi:MAG: signal peptidase I [Promethearchaeia archaeon]
MINQFNNKNDKKFYIILLFIIIIILPPFFFFKDSLFVITSPSMAPTLNVGDLVFKGQISPEKIQVGEKNGDILILRGPEYFYQKGFDPIFWNNLTETSIIHRAIEKEKINNTWYFITKGDNNLIPDGAYKFLNKSANYMLIEYNRSNIIKVPASEVLGKVLFTVPLIGYLNIFFPVISVFILLVLFFILLLKKFGYKLEKIS